MGRLKEFADLMLAVFIALLAVAIVVSIQLALWAVTPLLVYWVLGWFTDNETIRIAFACAAFAGIMCRAKGGFVKWIVDIFCPKITVKYKAKKHEDING